jgi:methionine aminotransferase
MNNTPFITSKLPNVGTTIFSKMSALATQHQAINLSQGFPNFGCDEHLLDLLNHYLRKGYNQYAPMIGVAELRQAISAMLTTQDAANYNPDTEITITSGATEALFAAIAATVRPHDEVIVLEPCYDSYVPAIELNGGIAVPVPLDAPSYAPNWAKIAAAISPQTRMMIINSPHNPSGYVWKKSDIEELTKLIAHKNIFILSDEVYEFMCFDGSPHHSIASVPALREKAFIVSSFGKTFHTTGWKVGYCLAPAPLSTEFRKVHQYLTFATHTPTQYALAEYLKTKPEKYQQLAAFYQQKRDTFLKYLQGSAFTFVPTQGTYFQLLGYENISQLSDTVLAEKMVEDIGVASIPISVFYKENAPQHKLLRFCFAKDDETLRLAAEKLKAGFPNK